MGNENATLTDLVGAHLHEILDILDIHVEPFHHPIKPLLRVAKEHLVPFTHLAKGLSICVIVGDMALDRPVSSIGQMRSRGDEELTVFQGARVQLNPGASIITSRLYCSSAGYPKKPERVRIALTAGGLVVTHPQQNSERT